MYQLKIHKSAQKALAKAPQKIQEKFLEFADHLMQFGTQNCRFPIELMKGKYKIYKEAKIDQDYRIVFRIENNTIFRIRYAGTHNELGTG